jgi:hypothetical protein
MLYRGLTCRLSKAFYLPNKQVVIPIILQYKKLLYIIKNKTSSASQFFACIKVYLDSHCKLLKSFFFFFYINKYLNHIRLKLEIPNTCYDPKTVESKSRRRKRKLNKHIYADNKKNGRERRILGEM